MSNHEDIFLSPFRGEMRIAVREFGKRLWEKDSDVFVFMARKAACFFDCLRELKITDVRGLAVSDRILDMDLSFLTGKTVTLVDDCVFSGTTLDTARRKIMAAGCKRCDTMTVTINKDWIRPELLPGGSEEKELNFVQPINLLDDSQCVQQCYDVVRAISVFPRPYDVDFPHTLNSKISDEEFDLLLNCAGWQANDVSSGYQVQHGIRTFTLIPHTHILSFLMANHPGSIDLIRAAKIRLYARRLKNKKWSLRVVPIVMLGAVTQASLLAGNDLWGGDIESLAQKLGFLSPKSRYRLLSFLVSWAFLKRFQSIAQQQLQLSLVCDLRLDLAEMVLGSRFSAYADIILQNLGHIRLIPTTTEQDGESIASFGKEVTETDRPIELIESCTRPFT